MSPQQVLRLRKSLKFTQQQLADLIGAQRHTVARWELGQNTPRGANLKALKELAEKAKGEKEPGKERIEYEQHE
jgi:DNA-binding transcriptional regulator YiaG